jgi:DNA polymerase-3 subunit beta
LKDQTMADTFSLTAPREALLGAVETAGQPVERRNTIPVLSNLLLDGSDAGTLRVTGTDLDVMASVDSGLNFDAMEAPGVTVPAALLADILRKLPAKAEVSLRQASRGGQMIVTSGRSRFTVQTLPGEDWPKLANRAEQAVTFEMPAAKLNAMLAAVAFAMSTEETRYYLNGAYLHATGSGADARLVTVATDGHRLGRATFAAPEGASESLPGVIIPRKTVMLAMKALKAAGTDATVTLTVSESLITFAMGPVVLTSKVIDGTFPDYARVIPEANANGWRFDVVPMLAATERVSIISSQRGRAVKMAWSRDMVELTVNNPDQGEGQDTVSVEGGDGDDVTIGFNSRYLGEMLAQIQATGASAATVALGDAGSPARFTPAHKDTDEIETTFVLMPMRV